MMKSHSHQTMLYVLAAAAKAAWRKAVLFCRIYQDRTDAWGLRGKLLIT